MLYVKVKTRDGNRQEPFLVVKFLGIVNLLAYQFRFLVLVLVLLSADFSC